MPNCKDCDGQLEVRASKSAKNPGRQYWSCPSRCKVWNGWIDDDIATKPSGIFCKDCKTECVAKESRTEKNKGKSFWSCPKRCKVWNGWVLPEKTHKTETLKRKAPSSSSSGPKKVEPSGQPLPKKFMFSHYCVSCDAEIDFDVEIQKHLKRIGFKGVTEKNMDPAVISELREAMTSGNYTCEECV